MKKIAFLVLMLVLNQLGSSFSALAEDLHLKPGEFASCDIVVPKPNMRVDGSGDFSKKNYQKFIHKMSHLFEEFGYHLKLINVNTYGDEAKRAHYFTDIVMHHTKVPGDAFILLALTQNPLYGNPPNGYDHNMPFIYSGWNALFHSHTHVSAYGKSIYGPLPRSGHKALIDGFAKFKSDFERKMKFCTSES